MEEDTGAGGGYAACTSSGTCNNGVRKYFDEVFNESFMVDTRLIVSPMRLPFSSSPNLCPRRAVRRFPPRKTLGPRRCRLFVIWSEE